MIESTQQNDKILSLKDYYEEAIEKKIKVDPNMIDRRIDQYKKVYYRQFSEVLPAINHAGIDMSFNLLGINSDFDCVVSFTKENRSTWIFLRLIEPERLHWKSDHTVSPRLKWYYDHPVSLLAVLLHLAINQFFEA